MAVAVVLLAFSALVSGEAQGRQIESFKMAMTVAKDTSLTVQETIRINFGDEQRHGIFRDIPVAYDREGGKYRLTVRVLGVAEEHGKALPNEVTTGDDLHIRIGDPNVFVSGVKTYVIRYRVEGAVNRLPNHDEIYWNVTGNGWEEPVLSATSVIETSFAIPKERGEVACVTGAFGERGHACKTEAAHGKKAFKFTASTTSALSSGKGLTVVLSIPKGLMKTPEGKPAKRPRKSVVNQRP